METFASFRVGNETLRGALHLPDAPRPGLGFPSVLMLHGFLGDRSEDGRLFTLASRYFAARGLASLRFDFRGSGDSDGDHAEMTVTREVQDAAAGWAYLRDLPEIDPERMSLLGFSLGGMVAALSAQQLWPHRLALWSPALPQDMLKFLPFGALPATLIEVKGLGVSRNFLAELSRLEPLQAVARAGRETHVFHGGKDKTISQASCEAYAAAANAPYSVVPGVSHIFEKIAARESLYDGTARFLMGR